MGTDIIEVIRIKNSIEKYGEKFLKKVFSEREIEYCKKFKYSDERFAGKFAAKEATQKALMAKMPDTTFPLNQIEIQNDDFGRPVIYLTGELEKYNQKYRLEVSVSHIKEIATATTILVEK